MQNIISKTSVKVRYSNFELLRIIAMFMVLVVHVDFQALGAPDKIELMNHPISAILKVLFEMASIVAVNVFVLISGWFGIRPSIKGISKFIFQVLFFSLGIYSVVLLKGDVQFSLRGLADCFAMMGGGYWFITSYLCLYILSPILNNFIDNSDKCLYRNILIGFFVFQTLYGFCSGGASFLAKGYSAVSFIGLYLLIGYFKRHVDIYKCRRIFYIFTYVFCTCFLTLIFLFSQFYEIGAVASRVVKYSNPVVILSALSLVLWFSKIEIKSRFINWIGASSFAVYLLHTNANIYESYFIHGIQTMISNHVIVSLAVVVAYVLIWFVAAILLDQIRIVLYKIIFKCK